MNTYKSQVGFFSKHNLPYAFQMYSEAFFSDWKKKMRNVDLFGRTKEFGGYFSFIYLDGDHRYEGVKQDFLNSNDFLQKGGCILFDDSADGLDIEGDCEVNRLINELKSQGRYDVVCKNPNYLLKKI